MHRGTADDLLDRRAIDRTSLALALNRSTNPVTGGNQIDTEITCGPGELDDIAVAAQDSSHISFEFHAAHGVDRRLPAGAVERIEAGRLPLVEPAQPGMPHPIHGHHCA